MINIKKEKEKEKGTCSIKTRKRVGLFQKFGHQSGLRREVSRREGKEERKEKKKKKTLKATLSICWEHKTTDLSMLKNCSGIKDDMHCNSFLPWKKGGVRMGGRGRGRRKKRKKQMNENLASQ